MSRRSLLSTVREGQHTPTKAVDDPVQIAPTVKPSRRNKLHIGGYYKPDEPVIISFQKLGIDLRKTQQEMLLEAVRDYVAKHQAAIAFS